MQKASRDLIVLEGRGAWTIYRESSSNTIRVDSPLQNIYDATRISIELVKRGREVIMFPVIDKLVPTSIYNRPRTYKGNDEQWLEDFPMILEPRDDIYIAEEYKNRVSYQYEIYKGHKHLIDMLFPHNHKNLQNKPMSIFDIEATIGLIERLLEMNLGNNKKKVTIIPILLPNSELNLATKTMLNNAITRGSLHAGIRKFYTRMFDTGTPGREVSLPIFFELTDIGYLNSDLRVTVNRDNNLIIKLEGKYYKEMRAESLLELMEYKKFLSAKYPIVILGYIYEIMKYFGLSIDLSKELVELYNVVFDNSKDKVYDGTVEKYTLKNYLKELVNKKDVKISNFYFVEGDMGGINHGTGGRVNKVFKVLADAMGANYIRIVSIERELLEPKITELSFEGFAKAVDSLEEHGSVYLEQDQNYVRKKISEVIL